MEKKIPQEYLKFLRKLDAKKIDYAAIKLFPIQKITDIDILIHPESVAKTRALLSEEGFIEYRSERGFERYKAIFIKYEDMAFYTIHLHRAIAWDGQKILDAKEVLAGKIKREGITIPASDADVAIKVTHVLFENSRFTKSDYDYIKPMLDIERLERFTQGKSWQKSFLNTCRELKEKSYDEIKSINFRKNQHLINILSRRFPLALFDAAYYYGNLAIRILNPMKKGIVISLTGNDGSGKTTVANKMLAIFHETGFRNPRIIHMGQKPFFPTTKLVSSVRRSQSKKALIFTESNKKSLIKEAALVYLWLEYLARYFIAIRLPLTRSTTLITDRYFYDIFIQNPYANKSFIGKYLLLLFPKPDYNFYLDCSFATTKKRKGEITKQEYDDRKDRFLRLKEKIDFIVIKNEGSAEAAAKKIMALAANKAIQEMAW